MNAACQFAYSVDKPELTVLFPAGGQIGTVVDVVAQGKFPVWPLQLWTDTPHVHWSCLEESGKLRVEIGTNAEFGLHWLRMFEPNGATAVRPYLIGGSPEASEVEPNNIVSESQPVAPIPITIQGVLSRRADVDLYAVELMENQLLAATVDSAKWLNSPADISLQVLDGRGYVLAENMDHVGLDPYLSFTAPTAGTYLVRVFGFPATPDSTVAFGGGSDWIYRLRLEATAAPLSTALEFKRQMELTMPAVQVACGNHIATDKALAVELPVRLAGTIAKPGQSDHFRFLASNGAHYRFSVLARDCGSSLDASLSVLDSQGKQLVHVDDVGQERDPKIDWQAPTDGHFFVSIGDFHKQGGDSYDYFLSLEERSPGFSAHVNSNLFEGTIGQELEIEVVVTRELNYADVVNVRIEDMPESISCLAVESIFGSGSAAKVTLKLTASEPWQGPLHIVAQAVPFAANDKEVADAPNSEPHQRQTVDAVDNKPLWLSVIPK